MRNGHDANIYTRVIEQHSECIASSIAANSELLKKGAVFPGVLDPSLGIAPPDCVGMSSHILGKLLDK